MGDGEGEYVKKFVQIEGGGKLKFFSDINFSFFFTTLNTDHFIYKHAGSLVYFCACPSPPPSVGQFSAQSQERRLIVF